MLDCRALTVIAPFLFALAIAGCDGDDGGDSSDDDASEGHDDAHESGDESGHESGHETGHETGDSDGGTGGETAHDTDGTGETGAGGDALAQAACEAFAGASPQPLVAATSAGDAATSPIVPDGQSVYQVSLPEGAAGFIELQIPEWETTQVFFTDAAITYTISTEAEAQVPGAREPNAACPDAGISDQRIFFPHWTPATIEFSAEGPRDILLMVVQQAP